MNKWMNTKVMSSKTDMLTTCGNFNHPDIIAIARERGKEKPKEMATTIRLNASPFNGYSFFLLFIMLIYSYFKSDPTRLQWWG